MTQQTEPISVDVLIVGAGISGINLAYRIAEALPDLNYRIVERRERVGGTWDLFRYPGIRSDSDFFTLSFPFRPWRGADSIADGDDIRDYLAETAVEAGIDRHIDFGVRVMAADWSSADRGWTVRADTADGGRTYRAGFLLCATGYYDYDEPYDPGFAGVDDFAGTVVHPQFWPEDLDVAGKRVTVIGSGATAVTLVPALTERGAEVTMLQRTPTYVMSLPRGDAIADGLRRMLPGSLAHHAVRLKNTVQQVAFYQACRRFPGLMRGLLQRGVGAAVGTDIAEAHFTPPYDPWDQRLCVVPGGDLFRAIRSGKAEVVTSGVDRFVTDGVATTDGQTITADIVVTATGLSLQLLGGVAITVDGREVEAADEVVYYGCMLSGVPNFAYSIGYINLSWTMRSDLTAGLVARVLARRADSGCDVVVPTPGPEVVADRPLIEMESGYFRRARHLMPRATGRYPWTMKQNVVTDTWATRRADLDEGLTWSRARQTVSG